MNTSNTLTSPVTCCWRPASAVNAGERGGGERGAEEGEEAGTGGSKGGVGTPHEQRRREILNRFRSAVHRAMTIHNNPSLLATTAVYRKSGKGLQASTSAIAAATLNLDTVRVMSVVEWEPRTPLVQRRGTALVLMQPEHEERVAARRLHAGKASFVPSIIFISCALAMLVIVRSFIGNMVSLKHSAAWLMSIVDWLWDTCDQVEVRVSITRRGRRIACACTCTQVGWAVACETPAFPVAFSRWHADGLSLVINLIILYTKCFILHALHDADVWEHRPHGISMLYARQAAAACGERRRQGAEEGPERPL